MSISSAMHNAVHGLRAAGRGAEVISSNISNALTPGYGKRVLALSSGTSAGLSGVREVGIIRVGDAGLASDKRMALATNSNATAQLGFYSRLEGLLGTPEDLSSLSGRLASLEGAFVSASSRPDAPDRLNTAVSEARNLADTLRAASAGVQDARSEADRTIASQVTRLNTSLEQVQTLNVQIRQAKVRGDDYSGLLDQRQQVVDTIGEIVPVREIAREGGQIALYSMGGSGLVDGQAATVGFTATNTVTSYMSLDAGTLSGLTVNDQPIRTGTNNGTLRGGTLSAQFTIRDELGVAAQQEIDALARDLVERFASPTVDPTLGATDPGLFTDQGLAFDPADELGLSSRIEINAAVDPEQGGETWRIRDGLNAAVQGPIGESALLQSLTSALTAPRVAASGSFTGSTFTSSSLVSAMISDVGATLNGAEQEVSYTSSRLSELTQLQLAEGVDTDDELQNLMRVEQAYAANARMLEVLDEMMQLLNRL